MFGLVRKKTLKRVEKQLEEECTRTNQLRQKILVHLSTQEVLEETKQQLKEESELKKQLRERLLNQLKEKEELEEELAGLKTSLHSAETTLTKQEEEIKTYFEKLVDIRHYVEKHTTV